MKSQKLKSNFFLLLAAAIWGLAFVAQRVSVKYLGSFSYNGIRFALGSISVIPLIILFGRKNGKVQGNGFKLAVPLGIIAGTVLFIAASLQQIGLKDTSAGKAAFITGFYIVLVPVIGIFLKQYTRISTWIGVFTALVGLYFLSVTGDFTIATGDLYELGGAFFWSIHILVIDNFTKRVDTFKLSFVQFVVCSVLSLIIALIFEKITLDGIMQALIPLVYGGILSVGGAYTLQALGQKHAEPAHAAVILSLETVFASIGGLIILNENLGLRGYIGCAFMLSGMFLSQLQNFTKNKTHSLK
ncbi:MAG TPA: DMT family transporter [Clostridia bacterium]|nr:DMT family transporter [Clostridia bacterium]